MAKSFLAIQRGLSAGVLNHLKIKRRGSKSRAFFCANKTEFPPENRMSDFRAMQFSVYWPFHFLKIRLVFTPPNAKLLAMTYSVSIFLPSPVM